MTESTATAETINWDPPGPGSWRQDRAHLPASVTPMLQATYPAATNDGFAEAFAPWGALIDGLRWVPVNGFPYLQIVMFGETSTDVPADVDQMHREIGRRTELATAAFEQHIWRDAMRRWDTEQKPASIATHRALAAVDLHALDWEGLRTHLHHCVGQLAPMWFQHHSLNAMAMIPVGDFALHAATWSGRPADSILAVLDGWSPVSSVLPPEMESAVAALRERPDTWHLLTGSDPADDRYRELLRAVPAVAAYVNTVGHRLAAGFDLTNPTIRERPTIVLGRLHVALEHDPLASRRRSDQLAAEIRADVPAEHQEHFDQLLADAQLVYRLRDERGLYSDSSAVGLTRLALIEFGRRLHLDGRISSRYDTLDIWPTEIDPLFDGDEHPTSQELAGRVAARKAASAAGAPGILGRAPQPPPPLDGLPPAIARVMSAVGFMLGGIGGEAPEASGDHATVHGIGGSSGIYEGPARVVRNFDDLWELADGDVLVTPATGESFNAFLHLVGALVTDHGSYASHAAIMGREMGFPAVVGCVNATHRITTGTRVQVNGTTGTVTICPA